MIKIGPVEKNMYNLRKEHPLVIPQIDPNKFNHDSLIKTLGKITDMGVNHIAMGGSLLDIESYAKAIDVAINDCDLSITLYLTNSGLLRNQAISGKTAVYWMCMWNAENPFFFKDWLTTNSLVADKDGFETIPTGYVFDDRGELRTASWLARPTPIPKEKPEISLSVALAMQYCGFRFYIMAGGSGCKEIPPKEHIKLLSKRTDLFLIPTSGLRTSEHAKEMFEAGADAIHVGNLVENYRNLDILEKMVTVSKKFQGKDFI